MTGKPYLLSRPTKDRKSWRYKPKDKPNAAYRSTGQKTKKAAVEWADKLFFGTGTAETQNLTLREATEGMFVRGKSRWMKRKEQRGRPVSPEMERLRQGHLKNHILPEFGSRLVTAIKKRHLDDWLIDLRLSASAKNDVLDTLGIIWSELVDQEVVNEDITVKIERFKDTAQPKGILDQEALVKLFPEDLASLESVWGGAKWAALFATLVHTGMRMGEAIALTWSDIKATEAGTPYVDITKAAKNDRRIGTTKNGKSRFAFLNELTLDALHRWRWLSDHAEDDDLIFPNRKGEVLQRHVVSQCLDRVLAAHSISSPEGRITPHSFRHTFNTIIRPHMDDKILQQFTGHQATAMTDYYDHTTTEARANQLAPHAATLAMVWRQLYKPKTDGDEQEIGQEVTA